MLELDLPRKLDLQKERPVDLASRDRNNVSKLQIRCQLCSLLNSALQRQWYTIHARSKDTSKQRVFAKEVLETR